MKDVENEQTMDTCIPAMYDRIIHTNNVHEWNMKYSNIQKLWNDAAPQVREMQGQTI